MKTEIHNLMTRCSNVEEQSLNEKIKDLPPNMQEAIQSCYKYAKIGDKRGIRYTTH